MSVEAKTEFIPGDPILIRDIISQLKSQGVFDQFRKECISDVDTKPAYQNLCHRVDGQVSSYLSDIKWGPDLNKNQLRENIRKHVNNCTFVEPGISRIVDQLVNPRINTVLVPKVEDIVYQYVGMPPVERHLPNESSYDSTGILKFEGQDSSFEKSWSSSSSYKRNHENDPSWLRSPSKKFDNYVHSKMDSSSSLPSLFDLKVEPPDEMKEKNEESRTDFFHSEGGEDEDSRAYSTIDSDEDLNDDVEEPSPSFEAFDIPDAYNSESADSDFPAELADLNDDGVPGLDIDEKSMHSNIDHSDENTNTDLLDDRSSQIDTKVFEEIPPTQFDVPKTPTINYETSEDSDDNCLKANDARKASMDPEHGSMADDIPDFSNVDKIAQKIAEDNRDHEKIIHGDDEVVLKNGDSDRPKTVVVSTPKPKDDKDEKHHKDGEKESKVVDSGAKDSKHRDRKYSEHRKDKHKSDKRDSSRDDRERKHREKERSNHDSSKSKSSKSRTESRDKTRKSSDEKEPADDDASNRSKSKDDNKSHRSHDDRKSRDKDEKKQKSSSSGERRSKDEKSKEKRSRSDDGREERKKSRHDHDRSKDSKKSSQEDEKAKQKKSDCADTKDVKKNYLEDEKVKLKKAESAESKKSSKSQCGTDEKKVRTDRRSSDRDSNGPSSSSNYTHHRSTSKSDREKHSDKSRHSSSLSSTSHKSKKSDTKSVSSDRHSQDSCENFDSSKHKEHGHYEKKKEEKVTSRTASDGQDVEQVPKDPSAVGDLNSKGQDAKHKEHSHHEKKKEEKVSSRITCDRVDAELLPKDSTVVGLESKGQVEVKNSETSSRPSPAKRSLVEMNSKAVTSISNELPGACPNSPLKVSESNLSAFSIKKPKIARNEFEFGKVVRLRKEYKEKMRLLQQQGKENNSESCQNEERRIMDRLSPVPALKEPKVVANGNKNGLIKDLKLSITRIDACYKIVDGSCLINEASSEDNVSSVEAPAFSPESDTSPLKLNVKPVFDEKQEKLKLKICRSISPTSGKERTKCVQSSTCKNEESKSNPTLGIEETKLPVSENEKTASDTVLVTITNDESYQLSENDDDIEEEHLNEEDLLGQMNIEEIIGCRTDCTRISYDLDLNSEKNVCQVDEAAKDQVADKSVVLFDENNKENVGAETQCVNDVTTNRVPKKSSPEVLYFEPSSPTNEFSKFVEKLVRDSEDVSLLDFSIELDYPQEYDSIFRSQLGATVNRVAKVYQFSSSNPASTSTVSSSLDTLPEVKRMQSTPTIELKPIHEFSNLLNAAPESKCYSSHNDQHVAPVQKVRITCSTKRKTLGIKRRISSISGSTVGSALNIYSDLSTESLVAPRVCNPASKVAENNAKKKSSEISTALPVKTSSLNTCTQELPSVPDISFPRLLVADEQKDSKRIYPPSNSNMPESSSHPISAKTTKKPRKHSPVRSNDEVLTEIVPKRTPYKNKCYYDSSDLYKPRPSFLASSRRSRALNPDSK